MISTIDPVCEKGLSGVGSVVDGVGSSGSRRPSYVGLSKSVSGYSTLYKYSASEERFLRSSPASSIPVAKDPQTLDAMRQEIPPSSHSSATINSSSSSNSHSQAQHEGGEAADTLETSQPSSTTGNLVQKQIERLYGGKISSALIRSPPRSTNSITSNTNSNSGGGSQSPSFSQPGSPLNPESSSISNSHSSKVPAVFRLLRPEFREQLKMHSCTVDISEAPKNERLIPVRKAGERSIPIVREKKPELPVKPTNRSPTKTTTSPSVQTTNTTMHPGHQEDEKEHQRNGLQDSQTQKKQEEEALLESKTQPPPPQEDFSPHDEPHVLDDEDEERSSLGSGGGLRERELLCTILEEDNESNASGYAGTAPSMRYANGGQGSVRGEVMEDLLPKKDGNYFIKLIENEVFKFEEQVCDFEEDLCTNEALMNEDVRECILAAIGKSKLLMGQKLAQFRGLCDRNINSSVESDPFVPTSDDLAGFWDMVYIQVEHIHSLFAELVEIRKNGWKKPEAKSLNGNSSKSRPVKKKKKSPSSASNNNKAKSEAAKARDEARKKQLAERKRELMRQKQSPGGMLNNNAPGENGVLMFI